MTTPVTGRTLPVLNSSAGGCACCGVNATPPSRRAGGYNEIKENPVTTSTYQVTGMTCGHCVNAVSGELQGIDGVSEVSVDLNAEGASTLTVTSDAPLELGRVTAALEEAGDYHLVHA